ncbi:MAG: hypothetical protein ACYDCK_13415 [Thermoplasmatota archaeon]
MTRPRRLRAKHALVVLVAVGFALVAPRGAATTEVAQPALALGDFWEFSTTTVGLTFHQEASALNSIDGFERLDLNGTTYDAVRTLSRTVVVSSGHSGATPLDFTTTTFTTSWARAADGAALKANSTTPQAFANGTASHAATTYDEPCAAFAFPLEVGRSWDVDCTYGFVLNGVEEGGRVSEHWRVVREESVTVPAGTFDALLLENGTAHVIGETRQLWYAPVACGIVKTYTPTSFADFTTELQAYRCASGAQLSADLTPLATTGPAPTATSAPAVSTPAAKTPALDAAVVLLALAALGLVMPRRR